MKREDISGLFPEATQEQINTIMAIKEFAKPSAYPALYDGGEPGGRAPKTSTREQFAEWFNSQG